MHGKRTLVAFGAAAIGALGAIVTTFAAGNTQISGSGAFDSEGDCTEIPSQFTMVIEGDLVGCWYTHGWEVVQDTPAGTYGERGTERFIGCLANTAICGTFDTQYHFTAKYAPDGSEVHGRCQHPITHGTGGFVGVKGRLAFKDDVGTGVVYYRGHLKLPNAAGLQIESGVPVELSAAATGCK